MIKFRIREMVETDIQTIIKYDLIMLGQTLGEDIVKDRLSNSKLMKYFVMENENSKDFIGQICIWIDENKAQINNLYNTHKYQNQKLGKQFLDYIFRYFKSININEVTLEVRKSNTVAINLYKQYNFKQIALRKNYYKNGEDAIFMYLRIGSD